MRKFKKGTLETTVENDDRRIESYLANGWEEVGADTKPTDAGDELLNKSIDDANKSEQNNTNAADSKDKQGKGGKGSKGSKGSKGKNAASNEKINDAISANTNAAAEGEAVDDGLIKEEAQ